MSQISQIPNSTITNLLTGKNDGLNVVIQMTREDLIYLVNTLANRNNNTHFGEWLTVEQTAEAFGLSKNNADYLFSVYFIYDIFQRRREAHYLFHFIINF